MALETGTFISDLVTTNPTASDPKSAGDDHLRLVKSTVKATFPNITGAVTPTHTELNFVDGVTSAIQTQIDTLTSQKGAIAGQTWTGVHAFAATTSIGNVSATEIAYLDGVTSAVQPQIDALTAQKGAISGQSWTGAQNFTGATTTVATPVGTSDAVTKAYADGLSFATTLPAQTGNSGKFVTTNGTTASWAFAGISQVTTATTATTLTNTPTLLQITPASYGVTVTLPNATTCSVGGPLHCIDNQGAFPVRVCDSTGALKGFIFAGVVSYISLDNNSTAAGNWAISSNELVGPSAQLVNSTFVVGSTAFNCIDLGSGKELLIVGRNLTIYGCVYDRTTNIFGTVTALRTTADNWSSGNIASVLSGANQVLMVSCATTNFEAVTLTISGTTITVNTAATATLSASITNTFADGCGLIAVGSSFVTSYTVTGAAQIRALSISGTTVTIGAATVLDGTAGGLIAASTAHVIAVSTITTALWTRPYLVSGSTLTAGTATTTTSGTMTLNKLAALGTRWYVGYNDGGTTVMGGVLSLNATGNGTTTISTASLVSGGTLQDAIVVGSNKVLVLNNQANSAANILTDTAGTASAGTAAEVVSGATSRAALYVDGTTVYVSGLNGTSIQVSAVDCSGASPVQTLSPFIAINTVCDPSAYSGSNSMLSRSPFKVYGTKSIYGLRSATTNTLVYGLQVQSGIASAKYWGPLLQAMPANTGTFRGRVASEAWASGQGVFTTKMECVL